MYAPLSIKYVPIPQKTGSISPLPLISGGFQWLPDHTLLSLWGPAEAQDALGTTFCLFQFINHTKSRISQNQCTYTHPIHSKSSME